MSNSLYFDYAKTQIKVVSTQAGSERANSLLPRLEE